MKYVILNYEYVLEYYDLTMEFKNTLALNKINVELERGHIYGFVGNDGAGKNTFMRLVPGLSQRLLLGASSVVFTVCLLFNLSLYNL